MITISISSGASGSISPQIVAAVISAVVALTTGLIVSFFAWRQWRVAREKLALDLFDRRLAAVMAAQQVIKEFDERVREVPRMSKRSVAKNSSLEFRKAAYPLRHLFGEEILEISRKTAKQFDVVALGLMDGDIAARSALNELDLLRKQLIDQTDEYMAFGSVGVARPPARQTSALRRDTKQRRGDHLRWWIRVFWRSDRGGE